MNLKTKLVYMALGGVLVLAGHVLPGLVVGSATAQAGLQDAEFNEVTVRKLVVVAEDSGKRAIDLWGAYGYGNMRMFDDDGGIQLTMSASELGGEMNLGRERHPVQPEDRFFSHGLVQIRGDNGYGGSVKLSRPNGVGAVSISSRGLGGEVSILDHDGEVAAGMRMQVERSYPQDGDELLSALLRTDASLAGAMFVSHADGGVAALLNSDASGGRLEIFQPDGTPVSALGATGVGGMMVVQRSDGETAAMVSTNADGDGEVITWDRNGYRQ